MEVKCLGSSLRSATSWLCDLEQDLSPPRGPVFSSVEWADQLCPLRRGAVRAAHIRVYKALSARPGIQ